jgi:outer membrane receptor protein involved in Fe transport
MMKGLSLLAQGQNVTNTKYVEFDPSSGNPTTTKKFGTTYLLGANYKF